MTDCIQGAFSSDTTISTPVAINKGGTGETTAQAALDALAAASGSLVQGDLFIVDASGNVVRLARGSDDQTLVMNGNNPNWEAAAGGATVTAVTDQPAEDFSSTSTSFVDTQLSLTKPTISGGKFFCATNMNPLVETDNAVTVMRLTDDGTQVALIGTYGQDPAGEYDNCMSLVDVSDADGKDMVVQGRATTGTWSVYYQSVYSHPKFCGIGVG